MNFKLVLSTILLAFVAFGLQAQEVEHKIKFEETTHDFGQLTQGDPATTEFMFTNTSDGPIKLTNVKASCGCTVPTWPREEIPAGGKSGIKVKYDSNRIGGINKSIRVTYDGSDQPIVLFIKGNIKAKEQNLPSTAVADVKPVVPAINYGIPRGALSFEKMIDNLRQVTSEEKKDVTFRFKNTSDKVVTIAPERTEADPEITVVPQDKVLKPGQESTIKVIVDGTKMKEIGQSDGYFSKRISIFTDEADDNRKQLTINGNYQRVFSEAEKANSPKIVFETENVDGGKVIEGEKFVYDFKFTNEGKAPLEITSVKASCGCTTPSWPKDKQIMPGESEVITASFNSQGRIGTQSKSITVKTTDVMKPMVVLKFTVEVVKDPFHAGSMMGGSK